MAALYGRSDKKNDFHSEHVPILISIHTDIYSKSDRVLCLYHSSSGKPTDDGLTKGLEHPVIQCMTTKFLQIDSDVTIYQWEANMTSTVGNFDSLYFHSSPYPIPLPLPPLSLPSSPFHFHSLPLPSPHPPPPR